MNLLKAGRSERSSPAVRMVCRNCCNSRDLTEERPVGMASATTQDVDEVTRADRSDRGGEHLDRSGSMERVGVNSGKKVGLHLKRAADARVSVALWWEGRPGKPGPTYLDGAVHEAKVEGGSMGKEGTVKPNEKGNQLDDKQAEADEGMENNRGRIAGGLIPLTHPCREGVRKHWQS